MKSLHKNRMSDSWQETIWQFDWIKVGLISKLTQKKVG